MASSCLDVLAFPMSALTDLFKTNDAPMASSQDDHW
jgi:hypothetical protein